MCRFFGLRATAPTRIECCLVSAGNSLMAQSRRDLQGFDNADGWGIAAWRDGDLLIQREASAAHLDDDFRAAAARVEAPTVVAHVRRATVGAIQPVNTHPFGHGPWAFVHNGTVPYFEQIRERMLAGMTPSHRAAIRGETDSEHLFHFVLARHEEDPGLPLLDSLASSLVQVLRWCREIGDHPRLGLNVLLTDGTRMVGSRWQRTLCFLEREGRQACADCGRVHACGAPAGYRALVVASEPTTAGEPWNEVPERSAFEVGDRLELRFRPLGL